MGFPIQGCRTMGAVNRTSRWSAALAMMFVILMASVGQSAAIVPVGLNPGDQYHLAFVTRTVTDAVSSDISVYNAFVQSEAAMNPSVTGTDMGVQWFAIAASPTVHARDNAVVGTNVPVYLIDGTTLIATGFADFWDDSLLNPISLDQFQMAPPQDEVWTGFFMTGGFGEGDFSIGGRVHVTQMGDRTATDRRWYTANSRRYTEPGAYYALSEVLTVAPEPGGVAAILGLAIACPILRRRSRSRQR